MPDILGYRKRIGIVVPSTNTVVQPESEELRPQGVTNHVARIPIKERPLGTEQAFNEHMETMRSGIGTAIDQIVTAKPDHLIMGVALEAFWGGVEAANSLQKSLEDRAGVGVSMGSTALVAALKAFGAKRIAVVTPHQPRGDAMVRQYLEEAGYEIVRLKGLRCASPIAIAHTPVAEMRAALRELDGDDVDVLVQTGTNLPMAHLTVAAEQWLGKPVLAMNVLTYWDALRRSGITDRVWGHGMLLEQF